MSGGAVFREALRIVTRKELPATAERDVVRALDAGHTGPLTLMYEAGREAGLSHEDTLLRGAAVFFSWSAGNVADDLSDGDCTYLDPPTRVAPCVQFVLQNLFFETAARARVGDAVLAAVCADLVAAAGPQLIEVRTVGFTASTSILIGDAIAGRQYAAYLRLLWAGTELADRAPQVGRDLGIAAHVAKDIESNDPRVTTLSPDDFRTVVAWAKTAADRLRREPLRCIAAALKSIDAVLEAQP